jgi:hypothetical protein
MWLLQAIRFWRIETKNWGLTILTELKGERFIRRLPGKNEIFNSVFLRVPEQAKGQNDS